MFGTNTAAKQFGWGASTSTTPNNTNIFGQQATSSTPATQQNPFGANTNAPNTGGFGAPAGGTGTGLFGNTGGGLFANNTAGNNTGGNTATGMFGQPAANTGAATGGTGLFGQPLAGTANTGAGMYYGQPTMSNTGMFVTGNTTGATGLFGQPTNTTGTTGTGMFGQPAASTPTTGTGLFGQPPAQNNALQTTGLFGQPAAPATPGGINTGTGLFGAKPGGLFGTTPATGQQSTGTGLFGLSTNQQQQQQQQQPGTGLFGSTTNQPQQPGTGMFGSTTNQPQQSGTGLFGSTTNQQGGGLFSNQPKPGGMFGTTPGTGFSLGSTQTGFGFGGQPQQQQQQQQQGGGLNAQAQTLFGLLTKVQQLQNAVANQLQMQGSALGMSALSGGGANTTAAASGHQESLEMISRLGGLLYRLSTQQFQHVFYNVVDPNQVGLYSKPPYVEDALWERAMKENPDPRCMVPAFAFGMEDLQKRADAQAKAAEGYKTKLDEIRTKLTTLSQRHVLSTSLRTQKLSSTHTLLLQRIIRLSQHLHLLLPLIRSSAIRPEEEQLRSRLEAIEDELRRGGVSKGRINEMWGVVGQLTALKAREGMGSEGMEWAVVDEEGLRRLTMILSEQQHGLAHLTKILQDGMRDLSVILNQVGPGGVLGSAS